MKKAFSVTWLLIATAAIPTWVTAQNVYKCNGNTYSQIPCPDGVKLPAAQAPDRADRKRADEATVRDARTADRMEKARLKQEQLDLKANTPSPAKVTQKISETKNKAVKPKDFAAKGPKVKKVRSTKRKSTAN